jgi:hypothetical protein
VTSIRGPLMIAFDCPKCGEPMEVKNKMAGEKVRCVECDRLMRVPEEDDYDEDAPPRRRSKPKDDGLSPLEWALFTLLFLLIPCANVIVSSVLYYVWRADRPTRAFQINMLGFAIFGFHILIRVLLFATGIWKV